jgi:hypothetical protein
MNRRTFLGTAAGAVAVTAWAGDVELQPAPDVQSKGPYSIEIISPPEHASRELPLFDSYKQAENFAQARMNILRMNDNFKYSYPRGINTIGDHETGLIKVWGTNNHSQYEVVFECSWGETWTSAYSYVDAKGRLA